MCVYIERNIKLFQTQLILTCVLFKPTKNVDFPEIELPLGLFGLNNFSGLFILNGGRRNLSPALFFLSHKNVGEYLQNTTLNMAKSVKNIKKSFKIFQRKDTEKEEYYFLTFR